MGPVPALSYGSHKLVRLPGFMIDLSRVALHLAGMAVLLDQDAYCTY